MDFEKKTKSIFYGMEFTHGIRRALLGALMLVYLLSLGFSLIAVTTLIAVAGIIGMCFEFPTGAIADYDSRKKSIVISFFLFFLSFLGIFLFSNFWVIAFFSVMAEVAWTFSSGANIAWAIDNLNYAKKKSKIVSFFSRKMFFEKGGYILGGLIGIIIVAINFRFVWLVVSLAYLVMMFVITKYAEEKNFKPSKIPGNYLSKSINKAKESFSYLFHEKNKELRVLMLWAFWTSIMAISSFMVCVPLLFTQVLNLSPAYLPGIYSFMAVIVLGIPFLTEKLAHKKGLRISLFSIYLFLFLSIIIFALSKSLVLAIITFGLFNIGKTATDVIEDAAVQHEFSSKLRASLGSLNSLNWSIANALGIFLAGISIGLFGITNTIYGSGVLALITAVIYLKGMRK